MRVVVDGEAGPLFEGVDSIVTAPDGKRLAYPVETNGKWYAAVDGKVGTTPLDGFLKGAPFVYTDTNRFQTLGLRLPGPEFVQLRITIAPP
jgi:hypothetical protein